MIEIIRQYGDFACGDPDDLQAVAQEWVDAGFTPAEADRWLEARCFCASTARALSRAGVTPEEAGEETTAPCGSYQDTLGYLAANGDMALASALARLRDARGGDPGSPWDEDRWDEDR